MRDQIKANERHEKEGRLLELLYERNLDAVIIGRQSNFAWLSAGGRNYVLAASDYGTAYVVITRDRKILVANTMDGQRILDEELANSDYELIVLKWFEDSLESAVSKLVSGWKAISDVPIPNATFAPELVSALHYPLTKSEINRYREAAESAEQIIDTVARKVTPGMSEQMVETMLREEYARNGFLDTVILIGADDRISKYRHPTPTDNVIRNTLLLAPSPRREGLFMPISRMVFFGNRVPDELRRKYDTLLQIEGCVMEACKPGETFSRINELEKKLYRDSFYPDEWQYHFMGGLTGYYPNDPTRYKDPGTTILPYQTFNWYLTITGAKVEEILLTTENGNELLSVRGIWPCRSIETDTCSYKLPDILLR